MEAGGAHALKVVVSVAIYFLFVSAIPIYTKQIFSGRVCWSGTCAKKFPYPIATAFLQLSMVTVILCAASVLGHFCSTGARAAGCSWVFGPHFRYKLRHIAPAGIMFGLKYGITNWGLALVPTAKHFLLQSTDLVWTVIFARAINKERLGLLEGLAALLVVTGACLISREAGARTELGALGLAVNLATPICSALCITTLRSGRTELLRRDNRLQGSLTPIEFTAIKLALSVLVALASALLLEGGGLFDFEGTEAVGAWWAALGEYPPASLVLLLAGGLLVMACQVNITWLTGLTSSTAVGIAAEVKVLPQWILNAFFQKYVDLAPMNLTGAAFSLAGSILFAASTSQQHQLLLTRRGFQWTLRDSHEDRLTESLALPMDSKCVPPITTHQRP